jgi:hypothetical protein
LGETALTEKRKKREERERQEKREERRKKRETTAAYAFGAVVVGASQWLPVDSVPDMNNPETSGD